MYSVVIENKTESYVMATGITEQEAENICESWGWSYDNGKQSFRMSFWEIKIQAFDYLKSTISARSYETPEDAIDAIQTCYKRQLITLEQRKVLLNFICGRISKGI